MFAKSSVNYLYEVCILFNTIFLINSFTISKKELNESSGNYWAAQSVNDWAKQDSLYPGNVHERVRNVVLFIGDGMGVSTVTAARYFKSHLKGEKMGNERLYMETMGVAGFLRTFSSDSIVTDSASSATAYLCGTKARNGVIGFDHQVKSKDCGSTEDAEEQMSFLVRAKLNGYKTGLVTTTRVTHASPAAAYAHTADRNAESRAFGKCSSIKNQLVNQMHHFDIIVGGGNKYLSNDIEEIRMKLDSMNKTFIYVDKNNFTQSIEKMENHDSVLALLSESHLPYNLKRASTDLSLSEITSSVVNVLKKKSEGAPGFVLFVEGGRIDQAHHDNKPKLALSETLEFDKAINVTSTKLLPEKDTLIVVTADHSHGFTINSGSRSVNLFGTSDESYKMATDNKPYFNLLYASGPVALPNQPRKTPTVNDRENVDLVTDAFIPQPWGLHAGEDVMVYAAGPMSYLFNGVHDNTYTAHTIERALGIFDRIPYRSSAERVSTNYFQILTWILLYL